MKWGKYFWWALILLAVNIIILGLYAVKDVRRFPEGVMKISGMVWGESAVLAFLAGIPGLNYFVMLLLIPILFFNAWTKLPQVSFTGGFVNTDQSNPNAALNGGFTKNPGGR